MKALDYIRKGWCQKAFAVDKNGKPVWSGSVDAVAWCAIGAIGLAYNGSPVMSEMFKIFETVIGHQPGTDGLMSPITTWNDAPERTHEEAIAAFEKAGI